MDVFSQDDLEIIAKFPLNDSLDHLQDQLRDAEESQPAGDDHGQGPITKLLSVLQVEEVAFRLHRKTSTASLTADIASHLCRIQRDYFDYADYRTLSQLVIRKAPDADIWKAVIDVIDTAIQQDFEEKQRVVRKQVFEEIRYCTYRDVDGFFEKYFEGKDWTPRVLNIYEVAKNRHGGLPGSALHAEALNWWLQFQDEFLSEARSRYYSTTKLANLEARRQMDLFLIRKNGLLSDTAHDWKHVEVVGKLKKEFDNDVEETLLQIGGYVWEVFSHQPTRRFVHAFTICGNIMEVWVFGRSGCYSPGAFDIHKEPKRFIQVIAGYAMMNEQELGLDTFIEQHGDYQLIHVEQNGSRDRKKLWLKPCAFAFQEEIVGRGTFCYLTKTSETGDWNFMTKFSWTSDKGGPESGILMLARSRGVEGVATLTDHCLLTSTKEMRSGLTFHKPYQFQSSGHPDATNEESYDNRILRCLVISPAGRTINRFRTKLELLGALRDAIKAHKSLYVKGNILHRNISDNNIIITDAKKTGFMGMLIDLSHAEDLSTGPRPSDERCPVGTVQFMAYQVLYNIDHTYRHDLESFFDVLVWLCARHGWGDRWPEDSLLIDWYTGTYRTIGLSKVACRSPSVFEELLMEFPSDFECLKPLCRKLRGILFPIRGDDFFMGTPEDPETLYKPMSEAFDKAINSIKDEKEEHDYQIALKPSSQ